MLSPPFPFLSVLLFMPLVGAILIAGIGPGRGRLAKSLAVGINSLTILLALWIWKLFQPGLGELQFVEKAEWIPLLGVQYFLALDGLGLVMVLLTVFVMTMATFASTANIRQPQLYYSLLLLLNAGLLGTFTAFNFFHWFIFWEVSLIPAFFLIKLWGGRQAGPAATQFFVYTMAGSISLLLGFSAIFLATGSFDFTRLAELGKTGELASALNVRLGWHHLSTNELPLVVFGLVFLGFAVKVPVVPFHTWLPFAYAEAPTPVSMILTGLMSKMGLYGLLRIAQPLFPEQMREVLPALLALAVLTIILSACSAFGQRDLKRMLGYSSINHLGYCLLGTFAALRLTGSEPHWALEKSAALHGVILQMCNHGIIASTLFCFVGFLEHRSGGLRQIEDFGGLRQVAPMLAGLMMIGIFASLGLPGLSGFVGEFLIFKGGLALARTSTILSLIGLLVSAIFLLTVIDRIFHGPLNRRMNRCPDLRWQETLLVLPSLLLMVALGVFPQLLTGLIDSTVQELVANLSY